MIISKESGDDQKVNPA